ncbi:hypothetical protein EHQ94_02020 [Leptospira meyeri]|uniref:hypothetical protein n=1 Tax=Leptospira meyeri TaxID=29508 RepID=UPI0010823BC6|nr:hypothetical protein [Leptospira meyeri]TGM65836.1 hypothetical protein EHQ93_08800 [Leptospira meyeri]TGM72048.1 hypothetical protein EHQ94_02020 [Leptospira meyeri]
MKLKIELGDLFEFETSKGKAILHFIGESYRPGSGEFIRILNGFYLETPNNLEEIILTKEKYIILFPLNLAYKQKIIKKIGNISNIQFEIPTTMKIEEILRGKFQGWYLVDPKSLMRKFVKTLSIDEKKLNSFGIWNPALLKESLENDWTIEKWTNQYDQ